MRMATAARGGEGVCGFGFVPALVGIGNVRLGLVAGSSVGAHVGIRSTARHTLHSSAGTAVGCFLYRVPGRVSCVGMSVRTMSRCGGVGDACGTVSVVSKTKTVVALAELEAAHRS
jgi:hypothetical protein